MAKTISEMKPLPEQVMFEPYLHLVADKRNWKNPINAVVDVPSNPTDRKLFTDMLTRSVIFYCGCVPEIVDAGKNKVRVRAVGYYAAVGA